MPLLLQVKANTDGTGASLMQENHPFAYYSKAPMYTQNIYTNTQCDNLAVIHGIGPFHVHLCDRECMVYIDHPPLERSL